MTNEKTQSIEIPDSASVLSEGPEWLRRQREESRVSFNNTPTPRRGLHLWRYTDPTEFLSGIGATETTAQDRTSFSPALDASGALVTDLAGQQIDLSGTAGLSDSGVIVSSLSEAVKDHGDKVENQLYSLVNRDTGKYEALNGALWQDGIFVYVPDGIEINEPLHLLRHAGSAGTISYPRLLVIVGRNAALTVIDEYVGGSESFDAGAAQANGAVEIVGLEDSRTRYVSVHRHGLATNSYMTHRAKIGRGATMLTVPLDFGAAISKHNYGVIMDGEGAESSMFGLLLGTGRQHFDNHTLHHHASGQTRSNIDFKVVLRDKALSAYTGLIRIEKDARTCEAYQENRNILLNRGARAEAIPELEILNEDVQCSHGATIAPIDPDSVFYLESRGIAGADAVRMILGGFVESTLKQVPDDLRARVQELVSRRLEDL